MEQVAADVSPVAHIESNGAPLGAAHDALIDDLLAGRFFSIDVRGQVTGWNPRAEAAFGWPSHHVSGASLFEKLLVSGLGFGSAELQGFFAAATSGAGRRVRVLINHQAGSQLPVELSIVPIQLAKAYELNAFLQDVSTSTASGVASEIGRVREEHAGVLGMIAGSLEEDVPKPDGEVRLAGALIVFHIDADAMTVAPPLSADSYPGTPPVGTNAGEDSGVARAEAERVRAQIDDAHTAADEARAEADAARRERDELQARLDSAQAGTPDAEAAQQAAADARREAEELRARAAEAESAVETSRTQVEEARSDAERLRGELDGLRATADGSQQSAEANAAELGQARAELSQAQAESQRLGEQLEAAQADLAVACEERDTLRAELEELREQHRVAQAELEASREQTTAVQAEVDTVREEATAAQAELGVAKADLLAATERADAAAAELATARDELASAREEVTAVRAELEGAQAQAEAAGKTVGDAQAELGEARSDALKARSEADTARAEADTARADAEKASAEAATARAEAAAARADADAAQAEPLPDPVFETVFDGAAIGMAIKADGRFTRVNRALCELTGRDAGDLLKIDPVKLVHADEREAHAATEASILSGEAASSNAEARLIHATGEEVTVRESASVLDAGRLLLQFEVTEADAHMAVEDHDPVTGLFNRRRFEEELSRHVAEAAKHGDRGAALMLDLANTSELDAAQGEELLKTVATALKQNIDESEMLAHLGGDEFAVLLPHADAAHARKIAANIVEAVGPEVMKVGDQSVRVTIDVGVALFDEREEPAAPAASAPADAPPAAADNLPAAIGQAAASTALAPADSIVDRIRKALAEDSFSLYAQPIIDLRTSEITQYELLLRMHDDSGRLMLPDKFLPDAQLAGLMPAIDQWVVRHAIGLIKDAAEDGRRLLLEVNVSSDSIDDPALPALIEAELDATGIDPHLLVIEITENAALAKIDETIKLSKWIRSMGCRFALDDFGSTFATVKYLKDMPVDYFKLDGDLIVTLPESRTNQLLLNALMDVARGTGTQTIAVYVPDDETLVMLRQYGIGYGQGNRVGRPRPVAEI